MKDKKSLKWLFNNTKKHIVKILLLSVCNAVIAIFGVAVALLSKKVIDSAVSVAGTPSGESRDYTRLLFFGAMMLAAIIARTVLNIFSQSMSVKVQAKMEMSMKKRLFGSILGKNYLNITSYHSGELMNRLTSDISVVSGGMVSLLPDTTYLIFQLAGAMAVLVVFDWKFALIFALAGICVLFIVSLFRAKLKDLHKEVQQTEGKARSFFQEAVESLLVLKTFRSEKAVMKKGDALLRENYDAKMRRRSVTILANSGFGFIFNIGYLYALLWCSYKLCNHAMTYGTLTAVLQLIGQVQTPFVNFTRIFPQMFGIVASAERIMEIEELADEPEILPDERIFADETYRELSYIQFDNVRFAYGRDSVLEGGSARISKGDFVAIRGISGIGKSTLLKMLLGVFSPDSGEIFLRLDNGRTIEAGAATRPLFSYVPQGNFLLSGTLKENFLLVNSEATDDEIDRALEVSDSKDFVSKLPLGVETVIGEKGLGLSEGQVQRIAIARAILSNAPVILLDEATSALDADTEARVLKNIRSMKDRTCVIVTHRAAALKVCDREFVIEDKILSERIRPGAADNK